MIYFVSSAVNVNISRVWLKERKTYAEENNLKRVLPFIQFSVIVQQ